MSEAGARAPMGPPASTDAAPAALSSRAAPWRRLGSALVVLVAVAVGAVSLWAASRGPDAVFRGLGHPAPTPDQRSDGELLQAPPVAVGRRGEHPLLAHIFAAVLLVLFVAALVLVASQIRWRRPRLFLVPRVRDLPVVDADATPVDAVAEVMRADADHQAALLDEGSPRNAIVACWHRFEVQADLAGLAPGPAETTSEFTLRLLDLVEADASAVAQLGGLYREARFSEHPMGEAERTAARDALSRIHRQLGLLLSTGLVMP